MQRNRRLMAVVVMLCLTLSVQAAYAQAPDADVFAVINLSNPEAFIPSVSQFIDKFQPGMGGMVNSMMVGNMVFKNPNWTGMNMAGEYMAVVLNPMKYPQAPYAFILPITNKDEYLGALAQTLTKGEETNGIYNFTQTDQKNVFVAFSADKGILAENADVAAQVKLLVEGNSALLSEVSAVKGQLTAFLSIGKILVTLRPMIDMFKQQLIMGMQQGAQQGEGQAAGTPAPPAGVQNMVQQEIETLLALLDQTDRLQLGIGVEENGLRLSKAVFGMSDSAMEKFMAAQTLQKSKLLGVISEDAAILGSGSINLTPEFVEGYVGFLKGISTVGEATDQAMVEKLATWAQQLMEVFAGDFAFGGLSQNEDSLFTQVFTVKDSDKVKQLIVQYPEMMQQMSAMYKDMGVDMQMSLAGTTEVKNGEILNYNFGMKADNIPDPEGQEVFNKLFGEDIQMPAGFIGQYGVIGFGKNPQDRVKSIMETLDAGADVAAKFTPSLFGLPEENNLFMYVSIPKIMAWVAKIAPNAPQFEMIESPGLGMTGRFVQSHFEGEMFLPVDELLAAKKMGEQAQQVPAQ
ncbi:hypothetical protein U27_00613 [Candidatus Vecturithrix granuli]|uniref:DUF3352 domain-containing protein n=1 Tax=Vecturithrix granuli TaxID=1499967 RepID=A0A081C810_VECG1|nr:hypothetical protein U27_00613 [Candidatus Vecturithrix granuli]